MVAGVLLDCQQKRLDEAVRVFQRHCTHPLPLSALSAAQFGMRIIPIVIDDGAAVAVSPF